MTREEREKAIDALKISTPIMAMTQEEFNDYIQTLNKIMDWLEQEPVIEKIRAEIEQLPTTECTETRRIYIDADDLKENVLAILDKYKADAEEDFIDECKRLDGDCGRCAHKYHCISSERNGRH